MAPAGKMVMIILLSMTCISLMCVMALRNATTEHWFLSCELSNKSSDSTSQFKSAKPRLKIAVSLLAYRDSPPIMGALNSLGASDMCANHDVVIYVYPNLAGSPAHEFLKSYQIALPTNITNRFQLVVLAAPSSNQGIVVPRIKIWETIRQGHPIHKYPFDFMLEMHDDMLFPRVWFEALLQENDPSQRIGILCPVIINQPPEAFDLLPFDAQKVEHHVHLQEVISKFEHFRLKGHVDHVVQTHPWLVNLTMLEKLGYYDESFHPADCEDDDMVIRAEKNGWVLRLATSSIVVHQTFRIRSKALPSRLAEHFAKFEKKHKVSVHGFHQTRAWCLPDRQCHGIIFKNSSGSLEKHQFETFKAGYCRHSDRLSCDHLC
jgi:hypothetical protein